MQTATLHVHPAAANPNLIFATRRLAAEFGCRFAPNKPKPLAKAKPAPFDPNDGGRAA